MVDVKDGRALVQNRDVSRGRERDANGSCVVLSKPNTMEGVQADSLRERRLRGSNGEARVA